MKPLIMGFWRKDISVLPKSAFGALPSDNFRQNTLATFAVRECPSRWVTIADHVVPHLVTLSLPWALANALRPDRPFYPLQSELLVRLQERLDVLAFEIEELQAELESPLDSYVGIATQLEAAGDCGEGPLTAGVLQKCAQPIDGSRGTAALEKLARLFQTRDRKRQGDAFIARIISAAVRCVRNIRRPHSVVITEREWYIYHGQHPPRSLRQAFEGLLSSLLLRVCSSPSIAFQFGV